MEEVTDMMNFLSINSRLDLKSVACSYILGLTGTHCGRDMLIRKPELVKCMVELIRDPMLSIAKDAIFAIVNLSADERGACVLISEECTKTLSEDGCTPRLEKPDDAVATCIELVLNPESPLADPACMVLSNLTRPVRNVERFLELLGRSGHNLNEVMHIFTRKGYNKKGANLHYLGPLFSNLSQVAAVRSYLMNPEDNVLQRLLPFTDFKESEVRRGGIVGMVRNCTFDIEYHPYLLSPEVDVLPRLLLPLAGPEEFPDDDMDKLPPELQYLPSDKTREPDPDIRKMLLEALLELCALRTSRELMRERNVYVILREFHKWETDRTCLLACENVVDILIRTEEEIDHDNLQNIEVPAHLEEKFHKMDEDFLSS